MSTGVTINVSRVRVGLAALAVVAAVGRDGSTNVCMRESTARALTGNVAVATAIVVDGVVGGLEVVTGFAVSARLVVDGRVGFARRVVVTLRFVAATASAPVEGTAATVATATTVTSVRKTFAGRALAARAAEPS